MPEQELNLILRLRDEATRQLSSIKGQVTAAAGAMAAAGFKAGAEWDRATKTIVQGTGATGKALKGLQADYQAVARYGPRAASTIADLNTHLGLQGKELQQVATAALQAGIDTNKFGAIAKQMGLDAAGATGLLDDLTVAAQNTGVDVDVMTNTIGRSSARWLAAGGTMEGLTAQVVAAATEFGPTGLRGAMSEILQEMEKADGVIPTVASLEQQLGDTTGAVERTYEAGRTWRDVLSEMKAEALAYLGPAGDMIGSFGTGAAGAIQLGSALQKTALAQKAVNLAMRANPIGLLVTAVGAAVAAYVTWKDEIDAFISGAWQRMKGALSAITGPLETIRGLFGSVKDAVFGLSDELAGHSLTTALQEVRAEIAPTITAFQMLEGQMLITTTSIETGLVGLRDQTQNIAVDSGKGWLSGFFDQLTGQGGEEGGGFLSRMGGFMQTIQGGWQAIATGALNMVPIVGPLLASFGPALMKGLGVIGKKIGGFFKGLFTGRGDSIISAVDEVKVAIQETFAGTERYAAEVQRAIADGWTRHNAEVRAGFILQGQQAGLTYQEAWREYEKMSNAIVAKDVARVQQQIDLWHSWKTTIVDEVMPTVEKASVETMQSVKTASVETTEAVMQSVKTASVETTEAVVQSVKTVEASATQTLKVVTQMAAKALDTVRTTRAQMDALDARMARIAGVQTDAQRRLMDMHRAQTEEGEGQFIASWKRALGITTPLGARRDDFIRHVNEQIAAGVTRESAYTGRGSEYVTGGNPGGGEYGAFVARARGGPVRPGGAYVVGEHGPEMFVPATGGSVLPNGLTARAIGEAVADALRRNPATVALDPVTDAMMMNQPRLAALRGYA